MAFDKVMGIDWRADLGAEDQVILLPFNARFEAFLFPN